MTVVLFIITFGEDGRMVEVGKCKAVGSSKPTALKTKPFHYGQITG